MKEDSNWNSDSDPDPTIPRYKDSYMVSNNLRRFSVILHRTEKKTWLGTTAKDLCPVGAIWPWEERYEDKRALTQERFVSAVRDARRLGVLMPHHTLVIIYKHDQSGHAGFTHPDPRTLRKYGISALEPHGVATCRQLWSHWFVGSNKAGVDNKHKCERLYVLSLLNMILANYLLICWTRENTLTWDSAGHLGLSRSIKCTWLGKRPCADI